MKKQLFSFFLLLLFFLYGCDNKKELTVFHAGSLSRPFRELKQAFEKEHPDIRVSLEASGSRVCCRKISDLKRNADLVAVADYQVIEDLLFPEFASWYICFATNRLVIAFSDHSRYGEEISKDTWPEILTRPDVNFGHSDPDLDPCGYRSIFSWQLESFRRNDETLYEKLRKADKPRNIRPFEMELTALLQNFAIDYAFTYESVAKQFNLKFISLHPESDLGSPEFRELYEKASVEVTGKTPGSSSRVMGKYISYAFTVPENTKNRDEAILFAEFILKNTKTFTDNFQPVFLPALGSNSAILPEKLRRMCQ